MSDHNDFETNSKDARKHETPKLSKQQPLSVHRQHLNDFARHAVRSRGVATLILNTVPKIVDCS